MLRTSWYHHTTFFTSLPKHSTMNYKNTLLKDLTQVSSSSNINSENLSMTSIISLSSTAISTKSLTPNVPVGTMNPPMGYTENNSATCHYATHASTSSTMWYLVPPSQLVQRLVSSWDHDPLAILKRFVISEALDALEKLIKKVFTCPLCGFMSTNPKPWHVMYMLLLLLATLFSIDLVLNNPRPCCMIKTKTRMGF